MAFKNCADLNEWLDFLQCPDCGSRFRAGQVDGLPNCSTCNRVFAESGGIWNLLPREVQNRDVKSSEKEGWSKRSNQSRATDISEEFLLSLPYAPKEYKDDYLQNAARDFDMALQVSAPLKGKRILEIGASACWASRRFAEAGAECAALDFDDAPMRQAQVYLDRLPLSFLRMTGDAESLPFSENVFDVVFGCAVLHHLTDLFMAAKQIARVLRPSGILIAIQEAFHPPYMTADQALKQSGETRKHLELGINEQSFRTSHYRRAFRKAGMRFEIWSPRWDSVLRGGALTVERGVGIYQNPDFTPEILTNRADRRGLTGLLSRLVLKTRMWKIAAHPLVFPLLRDSILNYTKKPRIILAWK